MTTTDKLRAEMMERLPDLMEVTEWCWIQDEYKWRVWLIAPWGQYWIMSDEADDHEWVMRLDHKRDDYTVLWHLPTCQDFLEAMGEDYAIDWKGVLLHWLWRITVWEKVLDFDLTKGLLSQEPELQKKCLSLLLNKQDDNRTNKDNRTARAIHGQDT